MSSDSTRKPLGGSGQKRSNGTRTDGDIPSPTDGDISSPQLAQKSAQSPDFELTQGSSTHKGTMTATGKGSIVSGNRADGIKSGKVKQDGSEYHAAIVSNDNGSIITGNSANGRPTI